MEVTDSVVVEALTVPIEWAGGLVAMVVLMFVWWVKREFDKNDREHNRTWRSILHLHKRLDLAGYARCENEAEDESV